MAGSDEPSPIQKLKQAIPSAPKKGTSALSSLLDDCDRPACDDMMSKMQQMSAVASSSSPTSSSSTTKSNPVHCPPSSGLLGSSSWNLLHSMAAWYPNDPTDRDRQEMSNFFSGFARFYPCPWCAQDFQENLQKKPVQTSSRKALCQWLCEQHNLVNEKLGKPLFPCDMKSLDERWRKSSKEECQKGGH